MNNRRIFIIIGILGFVLLGLIVLAACTGGKKAGEETKEVTLTYWRVFDDTEVFDPLIKSFQDKNPKIKIEYKKLAYADYEKTLLEALAAGKGPDLFSVNNAWLPLYYDKMAPASDSAIKKDEVESNFFPIVGKEVIRDDKVYGVPFSLDTLALFKNVDLISESRAPNRFQTWEDIIGVPNDPEQPGVLSALNKRQGATIVQSAIALGNTTVARSSDVLALMMLQNHTIFVDEDKEKALFNLPQKAEAGDVHLGTMGLDFYTSFARPDKANYSWNDQMGNSFTAFAEGRTALMLGYSYNIAQLKKTNPRLEFEVAPAPQVNTGDPVNYGSFWTETVSKQSQNQEAAWKFLKFMIDPKNAFTYNKASKTVPARKDVEPESDYDVFYKQNVSATTFYHGDFAKSEDIFRTMIMQVVGGEDPQRAIDAAANRQTEMYREVKRRVGSP